MAGSPRNSGFTVIELLVVLASLALLLSVAAPSYMQHLDRAREVALRETLLRTREAIDKFYADQGRYPNELSELVQRRYLRAVPVDPITERADTWILVTPGQLIAALQVQGTSPIQGLPNQGTPTGASAFPSTAPGARLGSPMGALGAAGIGGPTGVADLRSGAPGLARDGTSYAGW